MRSWFKEHTIPALTVVGLALYGVARVSYANFYEAFGVDPDEVGIGYATAITHAWQGLLVVLVIWLLTVFVMMMVMVGLGWVWRTARGKPGAPEWGMYAAILVGAFGLLLWDELPRTAGRTATDVKNGNELEIGAGFFDGDLYRNPLSLRADHVRLIWLEGKPPAGLGLSRGKPVTYLGRTSDTLVVYEASQERTLRIPAAQVLLVSPTEPKANPSSNSVARGASTR